MMNDGPAAAGENIDKRLRTMRILWAVFLWNIALFALLVYVVDPPTDAEYAAAAGESAPATLPPLLAVFFAAGLASVALSFVLKPRHFRRAVDQQRPEHVQTGLILALVLCEAAALLGVAALFVTGSRYGYLLFALAALGQMLHFPRREPLLAASFKQGVGT